MSASIKAKARAESNTKAVSKEIAEIVASGIVYEGSMIKLPKEPTPMPYLDAADALRMKHDEEMATVNAHEVIEANPFDALAAFHAVLNRDYGWAITKSTMTMFGERPPIMIDVRTGPNPEDVIQCPYGKITVPSIKGLSFQVNFDYDGLHLMSEGPKYLAGHIKDIAAKVRVYLQTHSIYKGKAFRMPEDWSEQPQFLSFGHMEEAELILSRKVRDSVDVNLMTHITHTEQVKADGTPIKRTVVLAGKYGTGKSMCCAIAAKVAMANGWTVIYLDNTHRLADALENAKRWQPCLVIAEDIDRVVQERTEAANTIFNTISGVLSNGSEVITLLTTNHPERIDQAMLRPGRIDALVQVTAPDKDSVIKLITLYGRGRISPDANLERVGEELAGQIPATIREVVERSKLARIKRRVDLIDELSLLEAVNSMRDHIAELNRDRTDKTPELNKVLSNLVIQAAAESYARYMEYMGNRDRANGFRQWLVEHND